MKKSLFWLPIIICPFSLFLPMLISGRVLYWGTPALQFVPWRTLALQILQGGEIPLWNPINGMGAPLIANYQSALFYPPGWVLYLFGLVDGSAGIAWGYTLLVPIHLAWAGIGMACLMERLGFSVPARIISSLAFSMCGYLVARAGFYSIIWAASWMPWVIWAVTGLITSADRCPRKQYQASIALCLITAMMLLAGHAQVSWYILMFATAWFVVNGLVSKQMDFGKLLGRYVLCMGLGGLLACIQLVPTAEYLITSQRASSVSMDTALSYSFWPWRLVTLIAPDFFGNPARGDYWGYASYWEDAIYIGIMPLVLALGTIPGCISRRYTNFNGDSARWLLRLLWIFTFLGILLALGKFTPAFVFLYKYIPSFNMFNSPARFLIWTEFSLSILAGIALQNIRAAVGRKLYFLRLGTAGGFAITLGAILAWKYLGMVESTFIRSTAVAGIWLLVAGILLLLLRSSPRGSIPNWWISLVTAIVFLDLFTANFFLNPSIEKDYFRSMVSKNDGHTVEGARPRFFMPGDDEYQLKFYRFFRLRDYRQIESLGVLRSIDLPNVNILNGSATVNNFDPIQPSRFARTIDYISDLDPESMLPWLQWMNVDEVINYDPNVPDGIIKTRINGSQPYYWIDCASIPVSEEDAWEELVMQMSEPMGNSETPRKGTIEKVEIDEGICNTSKGSPQIRLLKSKANRIEFSITTPEEGWFVVADTWYPGWKAKIDDTQVTVGIADYLFRGVYIKAGTYTISMVYRPASAFVGTGITILGLIILGVLVGLGRKSPFESAQNRQFNGFDHRN